MAYAVRTMIVDDEALFLERLRRAFPLEEHGFVIVGEAADGEEALELCERTDVDIIITDIVMPRMDGLELTQKIKEKWPRIKVILLSNYQEFEFARQALAYGAVGYMLKVTSGFEELLPLLDKARTEIEQERRKLDREIDSRQQLQHNRWALRQRLLSDVLGGVYDDNPNTLYKQMDYLGLHLPKSCMLAAVVKINQYGALCRMYSKRDIALLTYGLSQMAEEIAGAKYPCNALPVDDKQFLLLLHIGPEAAYINELPAACKTLFDSIEQNVRKYLPFTISIASHRDVYKVEGTAYVHSLKKAINDVAAIRKQLFFSEDSTVVLGGRSLPFTPLTSQLMQTLNNGLFTINADIMPADELKRAVCGLSSSTLRQENIDPDDIKLWLGDLTAACFKNMPEQKDALMASLPHIDSLSEMESFLADLLVSRNHQPALLKTADSIRTEVQQALAYIAKHYSEPVALTTVCEHVGISPNYFSLLFKKETGMNFSDYLLMYRIEQAKLLVRETTLPIQDIAEKVGIPDYKYFSKLFRKIAGHSPSVYKQTESS